MSELRAAIEHELRAAEHGLSLAELARRLRRRRGDILDALRAGPFTSTGTTRTRRWRVDTGGRRDAPRERMGTDGEHGADREPLATSTEPQDAGEQEPQEPAAGGVAGNLGDERAGPQEPAESVEPEHAGEPEHEHGPARAPEPEHEHDAGRSTSAEHEPQEEPEHEPGPAPAPEHADENGRDPARAPEHDRSDEERQGEQEPAPAAEHDLSREDADQRAVLEALADLSYEERAR